MQNSNVELKTNHHPIAAVYTTDSMRRVKDEETGKPAVKRWVEDRQVVVSITTSSEGGVFHRGARIA